MAQPLSVPGYITEATNKAREALILRLMNPPQISERAYNQALKEMADSMDITKPAALRILVGEPIWQSLEAERHDISYRTGKKVTPVQFFANLKLEQIRKGN